ETSSGVSEAHSPINSALIRPIESLCQINLQMDDRVLPTSVLECRMVGFVYHVQHDGARTKVERNVVADARARVNIYLLVEPDCFQVAHTDCRPAASLCSHPTVGEQTA